MYVSIACSGLGLSKCFFLLLKVKTDQDTDLGLLSADHSRAGSPGLCDHLLRNPPALSFNCPI